MLSRRLQRRGYSVSTAAGGKEALDLIAIHRYDLILLDLIMPDIDGMQVLRTLRERWSAADLPVIIASAKDESGDIVEGLKAGANDYVTKPLDMPVVLARVQTQLSLKHAMDQIRELEQRLEQRAQDLEAVNRDLTAANDRMQSDLRAAAVIQEAMLPASLPASDAARFAWLFRPCAEVAGDSLNIFQLDDEHVGMYILDVVGHGVAAALLSVAVSRVLSPAPGSFLLRPRKDETGYDPLPPAEVAAELGRRFPWDSSQQFFTLVYGVLNLPSREWRFVSAAHPYPVYLGRKGSARIVRCPGALPIGLSDEPYEEQVLVLEPGDRICLCSDGISEAMNGSGEPFGMERLLQALSLSSDLPLSDSLPALWLAIENWCGGPTLDDDASLIAFEIAMP